MKVYTKTGDKGTTGLYTGERVPKDSPRVNVYGTVDEADAALGLARATCVKMEVKDKIYSAQKLLWALMADFASLGETSSRISEEQVRQIEIMIDEADAKLPPLKAFVVPGDSAGSAALHMARTIIRRAERAAWTLSKAEPINEQALIALNRLSDLCFVLARLDTQE